MGIRDRNIDWQRKSHFIYPSAFTTAVASTSLVSQDSGAMTIEEISTFGWGGLAVGAAADKANAIDFHTPREADPTKEIGCRVHWVPNATVATDDAVDFTIHYQQIDHGAAVAATSSTLDTGIASQSPAATTAYRLHRTGRGIINANSFDWVARTGMILWEINVGTFSGFSANEPIIVAFEIDYMPLFCENTEEATPGSRNEELAAA
jgi:hypothetical protein